MATILTEPLKTAEGYYKRAWRDALKAQHPKWKERKCTIHPMIYVLVMC
jgi:hypothetical protein